MPPIRSGPMPALSGLPIKGSETDKARLARAMTAIDALPADRRAAVETELNKEWAGLPAKNVALRLEIAALTGYVMSDRGPTPLAGDKRGWSDADLERFKRFAQKLPASFKLMSSLMFITRDSLYDPGRVRTNQIEDAFDKASFTNKLKLLPERIASEVKERVGIGGAVGVADSSKREVKFFDMLFNAGRVPFAGDCAEYTMLHELGHSHLEANPDLRFRWMGFYNSLASDKLPNNYSRTNFHEGFAVGLGMYAVAPEILKRESPETFEFMRKEFGDSLESLKGSGLGPRLIQFGHNVYAADTGHDH